MRERKKRAALLGLMFVTTIAPVFLIPPPGSTQHGSLVLYASGLISYGAMVLLVWMYLIGAKAVMGRVFGDLAPVLKIHKWIGVYVTPFVLLHPILMLVSYSENVLWSLVPNVSNAFERHVTLGRIALDVLVIVWVTSALLRTRISFRPWKYMHYLAYACVPFVFLHLTIGTQYHLHLGVRLYVYLMIAAWLAGAALRAMAIFHLDALPYEVAEQMRISNIDRVLWIKPAHPSVRPRPGQYIYIKTGIISEDHPFSLSHMNEETGDLYITYRTSGMFTRELTKLHTGQKVYVGGPYGSFTRELDTDTSPVVYIAGGIGITPFFSRITSGAKRGQDQWLFAANRNRQTAVYVDVLSRHLPGRCVSVLSEATNTLVAGEESGHISAENKNPRGKDHGVFSYYGMPITTSLVAGLWG